MKHFQILLIGILSSICVALGAVLVHRYYRDYRTPIDMQVIEHLKSEGFRVDTVAENLYGFNVNGNVMFFDYRPDDPRYLLFFSACELNSYSPHQLHQAINAVMRYTKNSKITIEKYGEKPGVRILCENFIDSSRELDMRIVERSVRVIEESYLYLREELLSSSTNNKKNNDYETIY